jgi:hypothetical protein
MEPSNIPTLIKEEERLHTASDPSGAADCNWYDWSKQRKDLQLATWNVRSLYGPGGLRIAINELQEIQDSNSRNPRNEVE